MVHVTSPSACGLAPLAPIRCTISMNRVIRVVGGTPLVLVTALLLVSGCGSGTPAAPPPAGTNTTTAGNPSGSPSGSASPTSSASDVPEFSVDGAGPYTFG